MDEPNSVVVIRKVFLGFKNQKRKKVWISPKRLQALDDVPSVEFEGLSSNYDFIALEAWTGR
jgi:hypothetical protein